ncbi:MAG TPA: hypothetical protein VMK12_11670 [Anaeromyxobacteraceae bacterium]|nr:hypothetical protein [Anaeromyxobacteraceae bacterium]
MTTPRLPLALLAVAGAAAALAGDGRPAGIENRAIALGARAPAVSLPATTGETWHLAGATRNGPAVLVFYRGYW